MAFVVEIGPVSLRGTEWHNRSELPKDVTLDEVRDLLDLGRVSGTAENAGKKTIDSTESPTIDFASMALTEAREFIESCEDPAQLQGLLATEIRGPFRKALNARIVALTREVP